MFFFQAEDGIRYLVRSRGLGDVYKRQENITYRKLFYNLGGYAWGIGVLLSLAGVFIILGKIVKKYPDRKYTPKLLGLFLACSLLTGCLLYTSDAADERSSVDLGGRRIIKKKKKKK